MEIWDSAEGAFGRKYELLTDGNGYWRVRVYGWSGIIHKGVTYDNYGDALEYFLRYTTPVEALDNEYEQEML